MKLYYAPQARADLREIRDYIRKDLQNPTAANSVSSKIIKTAGLLRSQPMLGFDISDKIERETDIRCLISGYYGIFYRITGSGVLILRIIDVRTDYMSYIF